jgi:hypothetical protein
MLFVRAPSCLANLQKITILIAWSSLATFVLAIGAVESISDEVGLLGNRTKTPFYSGNCPPRPTWWPKYVPWCTHDSRPPIEPLLDKRALHSVSNSASEDSPSSPESSRSSSDSVQANEPSQTVVYNTPPQARVGLQGRDSASGSVGSGADSCVVFSVCFALVVGFALPRWL